MPRRGKCTETVEWWLSEAWQGRNGHEVAFWGNDNARNLRQH